MNVLDLDRNDVAGALEILRERSVSRDEWRTMVLLQDDPAELLRLAKKEKLPRISD